MKKLAFVAGLLALGGSAALADLMPGDTWYKTNPSVPLTPAYTTTLPPFAGGPNQVGTLTSPMTIGFQGTVTTDVFEDPATGFLSFHYRFAMSDMNTAGIVRATMNGWAGFTITDAGADASGNSGTFDTDPEWQDGDPLFLNRDPFSEGLAIQWRSGINGDQIGTVIGPGDVSSEIFFETTATDFTEGDIAMIDTAVIGASRVLVPIPEPATLVLLALGSVMSLARVRR
jgi:hypothetical protein